MKKIGTDGSALKNPGPAGWAWYLDADHWKAGGWEHGTNNQGELYAVLDLLLTTAELAEDIEICLDSQYTLNSLTQWRFAWKRKGWLTASGKPVKNLEIMKALDQALAPGARRGKVKFTWVRGHNGFYLNEAADQRARAVAQAFQDKRPLTPELTGPGWEIDNTEASTMSAKSALTAKPVPPVAKPSAASSIPHFTFPTSRVKEYQQGKYTIREHYLTVPLKHQLPGLFIGDRHSAYPKSIMDRYLAQVEKYSKSESKQLFCFTQNDSASDTLTKKPHLFELSSSQPEQTGHLFTLEVPKKDSNSIDPKPNTTANEKLVDTLAEQKITIFAREIFLTANPPQEYLIFFQGGPGCPANRSDDWSQGWFGPALDRFRLILLDQRATGLSTPIDSATLPALGEHAAEWLRQCRADQIVADAEALREYFQIDQWNVLGQSFGGFIITAYLSRYPNAIRRAFITGGLPALTSPDIFYQYSLHSTARRCQEFYALDSELSERVRAVAHHLQEQNEYLPNGELLTTDRFRSVGMNLGRTNGLEVLRYLLEAPFIQINGRKHLTGDFLAAVGEQIGYARNPLYILIHETCTAQAIPGLNNGATRWSADRVRETISGFSRQADPLDQSLPYYLTAEHFGPWSFSDPTLFPWQSVAEELAQFNEWPASYDPQTLADQEVPTWATIYPDDIYVPKALSKATGILMGANLIEQPAWHHDGLRASGGKVLTEMFQAAGL